MNPKRNFKKYYYLFLVALLSFFLFWGCIKDEDIDPISDPELARNDFYHLMNDWYLWYDEMPAININDYNSPAELLEALRYLPLDKWSYITSVEAYMQYYKEGQYVGHGFGYKLDMEGNYRISFVFNNSPIDLVGVKRGWKILNINGITVDENSNISLMCGENIIGVQNNFKFENNSGSIVNISVAKDTVKMNTVLHQNTLLIDGKTIGHMVLKSFIQPTEYELDETFSFFQSAGTEELILDLRYNGGGSMNVTTYLASLITGQGTNNQTFVKYIHNDKRTSKNYSKNFEEEYNSLNLERLIVITTKASASASESLINGLKPYINVILIGDDTYGKPVGMYAKIYEDYVFVPICFKITNVNDEGDYYDGITVNAYVDDNLSKQFGDLEEDCLKEAIYYIKYGTFSGLPVKRRKEIFEKPEIYLKGLKSEIGAI